MIQADLEPSLIVRRYIVGAEGAVDDADGAPLETELMTMVHHWSRVGAESNADGKLSKPSWSRVQ